MKKILLILACLSFSVFTFAQQNPIKWKSSVKQDGATAELILEAQIPKGHHLYSQFTPAGGPLPMEFRYTKSNDYKLVGKVSENPVAHTVYDKEFETDIKVLESGTVKFTQKITVNSEKDFKIKGVVDYQVCTDEACFPFNDVPFSFDVKGVAQTAENVAAAAEEQTPEVEKVEEVVESVIAETPSEEPVESENIWNFILLAMLAGFAAVLTPCVFPMIPMNISFFMQGNTKKITRCYQRCYFHIEYCSYLYAYRRYCCTY